jgi:PAS domain S-box-containing protein
MKRFLGNSSQLISKKNPSYDLYVNMDWEKTSIGTMEKWPELLQIYLKNILNSNVPSALFWGRDLIYFYNDSWSQLLSSNLDQYLGKPAVDVYSNIWPILHPEFEKILTGNGSSKVNNLLNCPHNENNNRVREVAYDLNPIFVANGKIGGVLSVANENISKPGTDHQRFFPFSDEKSIVENLDDAFLLADMEGNILYENHAARSLLGFSMIGEGESDKTALHQSWDIFDLSGKSLSFKEWPLFLIINGVEFKNLEVEIKHKSRPTHFWGCFSGNTVNDANGQPTYAILTFREITPENHSQQELKRERILLQTIFDEIPVMLTIYDPLIETITINQYMEKVTGWTNQDFQKENVMELVYPNPSYRNEVAQFMLSLEKGYKDITMTTKTGESLQTSWANIKLQDGRQVGIGIDISERKAAEDQLRQYTDRLQFIHEIDEAILSAHSEKEVAKAVIDHISGLLTDSVYSSVTVLDHNEDAFLLLESSNSSASLKSEIWPMPDPEIWDPIRAVFLSRKSLELDSLEKLPISSSYRNYLKEVGVQNLIFYPIITGEELVGTLNLGLNKKGPLNPQEVEIIQELLIPLTIGIEHERLHQKTLEKNRRLLETIINNIPVAISLIRGSDFKVLYANPTYYAITPRGHLIGKTLDQIWQDKNTDFLDLCTQTLKTKTPYYTEDDSFMISRNLGEPPEKAYFSWWLFPIEIPDEDQMGILNMAYETTERKNAEQTLIDAERLTTIGRMAASLAHEINNPIQSVVGCLGLAMENIEIGDDPTQLMDVAMDELVRASRIVQRMRDLGKKQKIQTDFSDINSLIDKVIILTQKQAQNQNVTIVLEPEIDLPLIPLISDRIHQVFLNLVLNAIEAMPDGGTLLIKTEKTSNPIGIRVVFSDTGKGIPKEELSKLFEAFHSTKQLGLGLGLFVSHRIVHEHGGEMFVESEPGLGTTFTVWLPQEETQHIETSVG